MSDHFPGSHAAAIQALQQEIVSVVRESRRIEAAIWWRWLQVEACWLTDSHGLGSVVTVALLSAVSIASAVLTTAFVGSAKIHLMILTCCLSGTMGALFAIAVSPVLFTTQQVAQTYHQLLLRLSQLHAQRGILVQQMATLAREEQRVRAEYERQREQAAAEEARRQEAEQERKRQAKRDEDRRISDCLASGKCPRCNRYMTWVHEKKDGGPDLRYKYNSKWCVWCRISKDEWNR